MRTLLISVIIFSTLAACGYRTPLSLPKPDAKPAASEPATSEAK